MPAEKSQNVQDVFLNHIRKNKISVTVFLVNGVKLQGVVTWFDNFSVLLRRDAHSQLVYKHAISTVMPAQPIQLFEPLQGRSGRSLIIETARHKSSMGKEKDTLDFRVTRNEQIRALVLHPELRRAEIASRTAEATLEEAIGLAQAIELKILHAEVVAVPRPKPATLLGEGVVKRIHDLIEADAIDLVVVDTALTPVQQRNLETNWGCKVIDRTGLILEIFGARARTNEGKLQVDLASLSYQRSRLVRSWTHLGTPTRRCRLHGRSG